MYSLHLSFSEEAEGFCGQSDSTFTDSNSIGGVSFPRNKLKLLVCSMLVTLPSIFFVFNQKQLMRIHRGTGYAGNGLRTTNILPDLLQRIASRTTTLLHHFSNKLLWAKKLYRGWVCAFAALIRWNTDKKLRKIGFTAVFLDIKRINCVGVKMKCHRYKVTW